MKKLISIILSLTIMVVFFSGCGKNNWITEYDNNSEISVIDSSVVAENDNFVLSFGKDNFDISFLCKSNGFLWNTVPTDEKLDSSEKSTLNIRVQDTQVRTESLYDSSKASRISAQKEKDSIKITYYFDEIKISLPVVYKLREDSLLISIDGKEIKQGSKRYQLIAAQPAPMLCRLSVEADDSYLFIPSGLGGTVNNKITPDAARKVTGTGANIASISVESDASDYDVTNFRCYGLKNGENGIFCIAEDTPGAIGINAMAGDKLKNYSTVFPTFFFTDYDYFYGTSVTDGLIKQLSEPYRDVVSVGLYPLSNDEADYNGMAKCYRNYLISKGYIDKEKTANSSSPYSVTYYGGVLTTSSVFGIPKMTLKSMTTFEEAQKITEALTKTTGISPVVRLSGYGDSGINIGSVAGGYQFADLSGKDSTRLNFEEYCKGNNIDLYTDFNLIYYSKSGNGFSYTGDSAQTAILHAAEITPITVPLRDYNDSLKYRLLSRDSLSDAISKLLKMADKKNISGISLNDLGKVSYSDYSNGSEYAVSAKMESDTKSHIEKIETAGHKTAVSGGTYFSAGIADLVFDAPVEPNGRFVFQNEIPFYQMVFHGITPMYTSAVNTASDVNYKIMLAASTGTGLGFSIIKNFDISYMETNADKLYAMVYEDNVDLIKESITKYEEVYKSVESSKILRYDILDNGITKTTFENGISIYANHNSNEQLSPIGVIKGYDFVMDGVAKNEN